MDMPEVEEEVLLDEPEPDEAEAEALAEVDGDGEADWEAVEEDDMVDRDVYDQADSTRRCIDDEPRRSGVTIRK